MLRRRIRKSRTIPGTIYLLLNDLINKQLRKSNSDISKHAVLTPPPPNCSSPKFYTSNFVETPSLKAFCYIRYYGIK